MVKIWIGMCIVVDCVVVWNIIADSTEIIERGVSCVSVGSKNMLRSAVKGFTGSSFACSVILVRIARAGYIIAGRSVFLVTLGICMLSERNNS